MASMADYIEEQKRKANPWADLGQGLLNAGVGWYNANQGSKLADQYVGNAQGDAAARRGAYNAYAAQLQGLAPQITAGYTPRGGTVRTALASGFSDPASGQMWSVLDPRAQGLFDKYLSGAQAQMGLAGDFDPRTLAQERLNQQLALLAPARAKQEADLFRTLQAKGLLGSSTFNSGLPGGASSNPYMAAVQGAQAQADATLAANSLTEGENYLDRLLRRSGGLFGSAQTVSNAGDAAASAAANFGQRLTQDQRAATDKVTGLFKEAYGAQLNAALPSGAVTQALNAQAQADAARRSSVASGASGLFSSVLKNPGVIKDVGNLFADTTNWFKGFFPATSYSSTPFSGWSDASIWN
jgi:hypothetical protein